MALALVQWDDVENKYKRGGAAPNFRAGRSNVGQGVTSLAVTFGTSLPDTNYTVIVTWQNTVGSFPQQQPLVVTAFSVSGFTVAWPAPTDSTNYRINWLVMQMG